MNRVSLPSAFRWTRPSTTGDLRVSAWEKSGPTVYTLTSSADCQLGRRDEQLTIVDIDKLLVDEGSHRSGMVQSRVVLARLIAYFAEESTTATSAVVDVHIMVLAIDRFLDERLLHDMAVDEDGVSIFTENDFARPGDIGLESLVLPAIGNNHRLPRVLILGLVPRKHEAELLADSLAERSWHTWSSVPIHLCSVRRRHTNVVKDS